MLLSANWAGETVAWLNSHNIETQSLLSDLRVDSRTLIFGRQVSAETFAAILDYGASQVPDENFGLHRGGDFEIPSGGVLAYLTAHAETVNDAVSHLQRYVAVACDGFSLRVERDDEGIRLVLGVSDPIWTTCEHLGAFTAARAISVLRKITGTDLNPIRMQFTHRPARMNSEYHRHFRSEVEFGSESDSIKLFHETTATKMPKADSRLEYMLKAYADGLLRLAQTKPADSLEEKVIGAIRQRLSKGGISLRDVANHLNMSDRTLRRRLTEAQLTFGDLLDRVRLEQANEWLERTSFDLKHISFLLGYSEPAAFSRAYKRWTGRTAGQTRGK